MQIVRINLIEGSQKNTALKSETCLPNIGGYSHVSENDRFHVITEHPKSGLPFDRDYLGLHRTDDRIFFQITLSARGLFLESKRMTTIRSGCRVFLEDL